jgi:type IV pilus biogenesis protein CpaD/CtpE
MTVPAPAEAFDVNPLQVDFGTSATSSSVTLKNNTSVSVSWSAADNAAWLGLGATSGTIPANSSSTLPLAAQRSGMTAGTYIASLRVSAGTVGADTASVSMTVPSSSSVTLAGQLVDQFSGQGLAGLTVQYNGTTVTTDGSGRFSILGTAVSTLQQLTVSGTGVYKRQTFARTGDNLWRVVPGVFNMTAYNDIARDEYGTSTVRWAAAPTVYIDSRPEGFTSTELSTWISEVKAQVPTFISQWTGTQMNPAAVIVTSSPPNDLAAGTIVIHFSDNSADYGGSSTPIGYAKMSWSSNGSISGSAVWLRYVRYPGTTGAPKRKGILGHELGHATGMSHMDGATVSFMSPSLGTKTDLSAFDAQAALFHYTRSPKNSSPDTDSSTGYLSPSGLPAINEWVCEAGDEEQVR